MKTSASHLGSSERVGRNVLEHLGEQLHPNQERDHSVEAPSLPTIVLGHNQDNGDGQHPDPIEPQPLQATAGTGAGVTGRVQSPQENVTVAWKDGDGRASSVVPKFASELARLVAAVDARDAVRGTGQEANPLPVDEFYDEELDVQDLVAGEEPIVIANASIELVDLDAVASGGEAASWSPPAQEASPDVPAPTVLAASGPHQPEVSVMHASFTRTATAEPPAPVERTVSVERTAPVERTVSVERTATAELTAPVERTAPVVGTVPIVPTELVERTVSVERAVPVERSAPVGRTVPNVRTVPVERTVPLVGTVPIVRTVPVERTVPVVRAVSTSDHNPSLVASGAPSIGPAAFEFSSPSQPTAEVATSADSSPVVQAPPGVLPLAGSLTRSVASPTSPAAVEPPVSDGLPALGPPTPSAAVKFPALPAAPELRKQAEAARVSSPPQTSAHAPMLRPVSKDGTHPPVGPLPPPPASERTSTQTPAQTRKHDAQGHSPAASGPKAPGLPAIGPQGGPASPVAVSPSTIGEHVSHAPSARAPAHAPGGEGPPRVRGERPVLASGPGVSSVATAVLVTQAHAGSPTVAPEDARTASVQTPETTTRKPSLLIPPPTTTAVAQPRSASVAAVPPLMKGIDFPSAGSRRDVAPRQADLPAIAPVAHSTLVSEVAVLPSEGSAPSVPLKVTSQALEVEHASRRRVPLRPAARGPAQPRRPEAPAVPTAVSSEPAQPQPAPVAQTSTPVAQISAPVAPARPAASQGRFKLPALIPFDSGLRMASLQRSVSPAAHPTPPADTNTHPPIPPLASPGPDFRRVRAAVLDLVQRSGSEGSLASTVSRKGIDTPLGVDKSESSARRAPRPVNSSHGDPHVAERPLFFAAPQPASSAPWPIAQDAAPAGQRRGVRDENATVGTRRPAGTSALASSAPMVFPSVAALVAPAQPRPAKSFHDAGPARIADAVKVSTPAIPSLANTDSPEGSHVDRNAVFALASRPAREAPAARGTTPTDHAPAAAASHELRATDLSLPAGSAGPRALLDQAAADPSLHAAAIGNNAHLRLETANAGSLSLHLSVRDGVADLQIEGPGARALDFRPQEIRSALAGEGLTLGRFEARNSEGDAARTPDAALLSASSSTNTGSSSNGSSGSSNTNDSAPPPPSETPRGAGGSFSSTNTSSSFSDGRRNWNPDGSDGRDRDPGSGSVAGQTSATPSTNGPRRRRGFHVMA